MRLGIIGYGSISQALIGMLPVDHFPTVTVLVREASQRGVHAAYTPKPNTPQITFVTTLAGLLATQPTIIAECAGHAAIRTHATAILENGTDLLVASIGAFADAALYDRVQAVAKTGAATLILPTGAIGGLDLLGVLTLNAPLRVTYRGIKPPAAWKGSPAETLVDLNNLKTRTVFFTGSGREAASAFPKNANVVAALALAGAGFDEMTVELIADPTATTNTHSYDVTAPECSYTMNIENMPSAGNARTSMTTVLSMKRELMRLTY